MRANRVTVLCVVALALSAEAKIKVLIVDGQNNHAVWPKSTIMMRQYLEETGLFEVDIDRTQYTWRARREEAFLPLAGVGETQDLKNPKTDPDFIPDFGKYDVVVSNFGWKAADWPDSTQRTLEAYMEEGGGFVSVHAADNCFPEWEEYNRMIGLGGWGGRNEKNGPYVYYTNEGELVRDTSPGGAGSHGPQHQFAVTVRVADHPITKGMPRVWMTTKDECYAKLRGPAEKMTVLATGKDESGKAPTDRHEPMFMVIEYGKGRVFHTTLGHDDYSMEGVGFIVSLTRGVEWAATGRVTQPIPADFPTAEKASFRKFELKNRRLGQASQSHPTFEARVISNEAEMWWARALADINNDGLVDIALQNNNARGGWLGWLETQDDLRGWKRHIIAKTAPGGETFACGDLDVGDIDSDGDTDIFAFAHPGEWDEGGAATTIYWYENPSWTAHKIGDSPAFVKDLNAADFNGDGKLDLVTITFEQNAMTIIRQDSPSKWTTVQRLTLKNLHEGMDVGDVDGDGDIDVAANGYWVENPGGNLTGAWPVHTIAAKWNNQTGDWSRNASKVFCRDVDGDGKAEVFISHSERAGYPIAMYKADDPRSGPWRETVLCDELTAAHTLQVFDFDGDGDYDVLTGINMNRAKGLGVTSFPVHLLLNQGNARAWKTITLTEEGIYNGQAADIEGDGDVDLFRLPTHDGTVFEVWLNQTSDGKRVGLGARPSGHIMPIKAREDGTRTTSRSSPPASRTKSSSRKPS